MQASLKHLEGRDRKLFRDEADTDKRACVAQEGEALSVGRGPGCADCGVGAEAVCELLY